jgi:NADH dehydrogenase [ubiquinone] 1 alpha subcomplex assembly factor 7
MGKAMTALADRIAKMIAADGPMPVSQYMTLCQFDPQAGSYAARRTIGRDFITSPEISQTFGELLGLWIVQTWHNQGRPENPRLVELGPGRGALMADALRAIMAAAPELLMNAEVNLVEASPALVAVQRERLKNAATDIDWHDRFDESLTDRPLFLIANEFFDCLPVRQFVKTERGWCERMVVTDNGALSFALSPVPTTAVPPDRGDAPNGAVYEVAAWAIATSEQIARCIAEHGGAAVLIDYGYDEPGTGETLQALADGKYVDVLAAPGESDLSAHVDFPALAKAATDGGAAVYGPVTQCNFLADLGIGPRAERLMIANPTQAREIATAVDRLVNPELMGALFKVIAIMPASAEQPPGFELP